MKRAPDEQRRRTCGQCGKEFFTKPSAKGAYCSYACRGLAQRTRPPNDPRPCETCGEVFQPARKAWAARFCSKACVQPTPEHLEKLHRRAQETLALRADALRDRGEGKTYRKLNGRHEHRVVAEKKLGRPLQPGEIVHHVDGDVRNNDPDNLEVMTQAEHMREHGLGVPGVAPQWKPWEYRK